MNVLEVLGINMLILSAIVLLYLTVVILELSAFTHGWKRVLWVITLVAATWCLSAVWYLSPFELLIVST